MKLRKTNSHEAFLTLSFFLFSSSSHPIFHDSAISGSYPPFLVPIRRFKISKLTYDMAVRNEYVIALGLRSNLRVVIYYENVGTEKERGRKKAREKARETNSR